MDARKERGKDMRCRDLLSGEKPLGRYECWVKEVVIEYFIERFVGCTGAEVGEGCRDDHDGWHDVHRCCGAKGSSRHKTNVDIL